MSDLISRSALMQEIKSLTVIVTGLRAGKGILNEYAKQYRDALLRIVNEQPTIEAIPVVHGEWVKNDIGIYFCSECDSEAYWDTDYGQQLFPCCPYCGIRMDGAK